MSQPQSLSEEKSIHEGSKIYPKSSSKKVFSLMLVEKEDWALT